MIKKKHFQSIALKPGSEMREMYTKVPFAITIKVYLFHVVNPVEVTAGAKPILKEIGPYIFEYERILLFTLHGEH